MAASTALLVIFYSSLSYAPVNAAFPIPINQLPKGSAGSSTLDIRVSKYAASDNNHGAFRIHCDMSHMNYDDPIVFPNQVGATHLHMFFGNTKTDANSTYKSLLRSGNSTCSAGIGNRSAYWVPAMLDASGKPVMPGTAVMYYKSFNTKIVKNIPNGIRLLAGDSKANTPLDTRYIRWSCQMLSGQSVVGTSSGIPVCPKGSMIRLQMDFPRCWDGFNLDSPDHKSHMSHPGSRGCPKSHPVELPIVTFNFFWSINSPSTAGWRLSSDMYDRSLPGGYSAHGDWMEAWNPEVRQTWFNNCILGNKDCGMGNLANGNEIYIKR